MSNLYTLFIYYFKIFKDLQLMFERLINSRHSEQSMHLFSLSNECSLCFEMQINRN